MKYLACQPSRLSKQSTTSSMAYSLLMTGFTQPDSMPATIAAFKFDSRNKKEEARIGKWTPTPISAHSDGLVVPKATPQMLAYDQDIWQLKEGLVTKLKKNLWHHEVPGVDVDATSATDDHHSVKYCHSGNY